MIPGEEWQLSRAEAISGRTIYGNGERPACRQRIEHGVSKLSMMSGDRLGTTVRAHGLRDMPDVGDLIGALAWVAPPERAACGVSSVSGGARAVVPDRSVLSDLHWLDRLGEDWTEVKYLIQNGARPNRCGVIEEHWIHCGLAGRTLARVPVDASIAAQERPAPAPGHWLFPPYVLSEILLEPITGALLGRQPLRKLPRVTLADPAWGDELDLDGIRREPAAFAAGRALLSKPADVRTAWLEGRPPTGHGGMSGPVVRDLVLVGHPPPSSSASSSLSPPFPPASPLPPGTIVAEGARLAMGADGRDALIGLSPMTADNALGRLEIIAVDDVCDLIDAGQWRGPWQRGIGPWTSTWLSIDAKWLRNRRTPS
jgi:hypothetical protein